VKRGDPDGTDPNNPVVIYADGVFDMYHIGHARVLEQCKKLFKHVYLIVGINKDKDVLKYKGQYVMTQEERGQIIQHCKWVDELIVGCPW
jgi:choline-phosphate cytidylyltransferase